MKLALIGVVAVVAAAFATPVLAQEDPGYRAQFYSNANGQNLDPGNPHADGNYYRGWQSGNTMLLHHANEPDRYRYHGGPKSND
jgi:hypothetical protein